MTEQMSPMPQKLPDNSVPIKTENKEKLKIDVRFATLEDWETVKNLRLEALEKDEAVFHGKNHEFTEKEIMKTPEDWQNELKSEDMFTVLSFVDKKPVGFGRVGKQYNEQNLWWMGQAYVKEEFREKGVAKKMFALRLKKVEENNGVQVALGIWHENLKKMLPLSESFGFYKTSKEPNEYGFYRMELNDLNNSELLKKINDVLSSD